MINHRNDKCFGFKQKNAPPVQVHRVQAQLVVHFVLSSRTAMQAVRSYTIMLLSALRILRL